MTAFIDIVLTNRSIYLAILFFIAAVGHFSVWYRLRDDRYRLAKSAAWLFMSFVWLATEFREHIEWFSRNQRLFVSLAQTGLVTAELYVVVVLDNLVKQVMKWKATSK